MCTFWHHAKFHVFVHQKKKKMKSQISYIAYMPAEKITSDWVLKMTATDNYFSELKLSKDNLSENQFKT